MDNELKSMLQTVILEALEPINKRLNQIESNMATKQDLKDISIQLNSRFDNLDTEAYLVKQDVATIKANVALLALKPYKMSWEC